MTEPTSAEQLAALRDELGQKTGPCHFSDLRAHLTRQAVFVVHQRVKLVDAALALAIDDAKQVQEWIDSGALRRPSLDELKLWEKESPSFTSTVVQPWVLIHIQTETS